MLDNLTIVLIGLSAFIALLLVGEVLAKVFKWN